MKDPVYDSIEIDAITIGHRHRTACEERVLAMMESLKEIGLKTPISVQVLREGEEVRLVAGLHRLEAARRLGWQYIDIRIEEGTELDAELWEIDENLMRAELSPAERADHVARRKAIYEEMHPEVRHGAIGNGREKSGKVCHSTPAERFTADTAAKTGRSERAVRLDAERGTKIAPEVMAEVRGTPLDKGVVLDILAGTPKEQQPEKLAEIKAEIEAKKAAKARKPKPAPKPAQESHEAKLADFMASYIAQEHWDDVLAMLPAIKPAKLATAFKRRIAELGDAA